MFTAANRTSRFVSFSFAVLMTVVVNGGMLSDRKGVNVPGVVLPLSAMTDKDRADLDFGLSLVVQQLLLALLHTQLLAFQLLMGLAADAAIGTARLAGRAVGAAADAVIPGGD